MIIERTRAWLKKKSFLNIHRVFEVSLILKGLFSLCEIVTSILIFFIPLKSINNIVIDITQLDFLHDHMDFLTHHLQQWVQHFSVGSKHFASFYLLSHGIIKLWMVIGLLQKKLKYFPPAITIFGLLIAYQIYRIFHTHSIMLIFLTMFDFIVIILACNEFRYLYKQHKGKGGGVSTDGWKNSKNIRGILRI